MAWLTQAAATRRSCDASHNSSRPSPDPPARHTEPPKITPHTLCPTTNLQSKPLSQTLSAAPSALTARSDGAPTATCCSVPQCTYRNAACTYTQRTYATAWRSGPPATCGAGMPGARACPPWSSARGAGVRELSIEQNENRNQRTTGPIINDNRLTISFGRELSIEQHRKGQCTVRPYTSCVHYSSTGTGRAVETTMNSRSLRYTVIPH
eukprot:COSAG02_NODE_16032_length_1119_cov_1.641176_1_plen_209_part_00